MYNDFSVSNHSPSSTANTVRGPAGQQTMSGYKASQEVANRARVTVPMNDYEFRNAVNRLSQNLESGMELRRDVPRGYYFNITI